MWDPQELLRACDLAVWEFDHLLDGQKPFQPYHTHQATSPIIDLSRGFDAYLASRRDRSRFRDLSRRHRKLSREVGEVRFVFDSRDRAALHTLMRWKSAQYQRTGRADRFARPWIIHLLEQLFEERTNSFAGLLSCLYAGEELLAVHFGLRSARVLPTWFGTYHARFSKYSPGLLLHLFLARAAAATGIQHIDMGRGTMPYKELLKNGDLFVAEGRVARRVPAAALHWARRVPLRRLRTTVTEHPALFRVADRLLRHYGRARLSATHILCKSPQPDTVHPVNNSSGPAVRQGKTR